MPKKAECDRAYLHTSPGPDGYVARSEWAESRLRTHTQRRCPRCGLYVIWVPKRERVSPQMLRVLRYIERGQNEMTGVRTLGEYGGRSNTLTALERRGWINVPEDPWKPTKLTKAGRRVLEKGRGAQEGR